MKTDANTLRADEAEPASAADPFAVDLFAGDTGVAVGAAAADVSAGESPRAPSWDESLPKVTREEARLSAMLAAAPASLSRAAGAALARLAAGLMQAGDQEVAFDVLETREEDLAGAEARAESPRAFVRVSVEPWEARVVLVVEAAFAAAVVDRMLGGDGAGPADVPRALSTAERAVLEFLCAQLLAGLNEEAGEPLFRLEAVTGEGGGWGRGRGIVTTARVRLGRTSGIVRLVYGPAALAALDELRSPLLTRPDSGRAKLARYQTLCTGADMAVVVGEADVDTDSLAGLEPGDVVVVERVFGEWDGGAARGTLRARVGGGDNVRLDGVAAKRPAGAGDGAAGRLRLLVEEISVAEAREAGRLHMEEESELEAEAGEETGLLDSLLLTVRVELPARRISLEELTRLRAGQIVDLDCRATDPVELVADGRRIATGELVDIEGRLGVRVTRLAG
jgi:flagellar motor switch protein FliM